MAREIPTPAGGIISYFTRHPTLANLMVVLILLVGLSTIPNMRTQFFPDVVNETVVVAVDWEGAGANDVDRSVIQLLESALIVIDGVESTSTRANEGGGSISLAFQANWDMSR
ncbi:MAG: efflux RND transporter permease subunit, partial [Roseobacter sp.]